MLRFTKLWEGWARTRAGDAARGRILLEESVALSSQIGTKMQLSYAKAILAESLMALAEPDAILGLCREALRLAEETGDKFGTALAHRVLAEATAQLAPSDLESAERAMLEAIRIHQEIGTKPELART